MNMGPMTALATSLLFSALLAQVGSAASVKEEHPKSALVKHITNSVMELKNVARHAVQLDGAEAPAVGAGGGGGRAFLQQSQKPELNRTLKEEQPGQLSEHQKAPKPDFMQAREQEQPNQLHPIALHQPEAALVQTTMVQNQKEHEDEKCDMQYDGDMQKAVEKWFDADKNGNIDKEECGNIKAVFAYFDADGDDKLGADEWKKMEEVIKIFDADGNGVLDKDEMTKLMDALKDADASNDGKLQDEEIEALKKKHAKPAEAKADAVCFSVASSIAVVVLVHLL